MILPPSVSITTTDRTSTLLPVGGLPMSEPRFVPRQTISAAPLLPSTILLVIVPRASGNASFHARAFAVPSCGVKRRPVPGILIYFRVHRGEE